MGAQRGGNGRHAYAGSGDQAGADRAGKHETADNEDPPWSTDGSEDDEALDLDAPTRATRPDEARSRWRTRLAGALADHLPPAVRGARWRLSGTAALAVVIGLVLAVGSAALVANRDSPEMIMPGPVAITSAASVTPGYESGSTPTSSATVMVHVAGFVTAPGVFELPLGSRVVDAIAAAGGVQAGVDTSTLNLARVLVDGEQIAVGVPAAPDAGGGSGSASGESAGTPLDLNRATEAELDGLPGVGPVLAARIVAWREEHGSFTAVEELLEVSGIGTATLADLVDLVRV